jgi:hypothetical protein
VPKASVGANNLLLLVSAKQNRENFWKVGSHEKIIPLMFLVPWGAKKVIISGGLWPPAPQIKGMVKMEGENQRTKGKSFNANGMRKSWKKSG